jgi:hypothetical protein
LRFTLRTTPRIVGSYPAAMSPGDPLPLEKYALALAHLLQRRGEPLASVLEALDIGVDDFRRAEEHYNPQLAECHAHRKGVLAMKFAAAFAGARAELGLLESAAAPGHAAPAGPSPVRAAPVAPEVPSYLGANASAPEPTPPPVRGPAPDAVAATADISAFVPRGPLPFAKPAGPPPVPPAAPPRRDPAAPPAGSGTEDLRGFVPQPATPFGEATPGVALPRMRLIRFDPQTGAPLAEPRWVEVPGEPTGGAPPKR